MINGYKRIGLLIGFLVMGGFLFSEFTKSSEGNPATWKIEWSKTDFNSSSIDFSEILSGGPPKDGIPSIDEPTFVSYKEADKWLSSNEPVISVEINNVARAYPIQIVIWHEIVNDTLGGTPITVTFCPLCNSSIVFDRRLKFGGKSYLFDFVTTGKLRNSDLIMYDRQTESWWQQFIGEAIVGKLTGATLKMLSSNLISYANFKASYPDGKTLSKKTGIARNYGSNPYVGYDDINNSPFLFKDATDKRLPPMERIINVTLNGIDKIYPLSEAMKKQVIHDRINGEELVIFHLPGTASALDKGTIASSRDIGAATAFLSTLNKKKLTFKRSGGVFVDDQTGSEWNITGKAIKGTLSGKQLNPVIHGNHFAFAWLAFKPKSIIYTGAQ